MQSLLSVLLVILIIGLVLVVFVPALLERRARQNAEQSGRFAAELQEHEREARRLELTIAPYARGRSSHFSERATVARERLAALHAHLDAAGDTLAQMRCPQVYRYLLPVQHFVLAPRDAAAIVADSRRVARLRGQLRAATGAAEAARAAVETLTTLPAALAESRHETAGHLDAVEAAIRAEHKAGIAEMGDVERELARLRGLLARPAAPLAGDKGGPATLSALDGEALALEEAAAGVAPLRVTLTAVADERAHLDEALRRATADLDDLQASKAGPDPRGPAQVRPLLLQAAALLNESAPAHRRRRDFPAAAADVAAAKRFMTLARDLSAADARSRLLAERDDGVSLSEVIAEVRRDLADLLDRVGGDSAAGQPSAAREAALVARAADVRRRADDLVERQSEIIAGLERDAAAIGDRLARDWEAAQRLLRLAAEDPLARRQARLLAQVDEARRHPEALARLRDEAAAFEAVLTPWVTRVQDARRRVARLRERLPALIDTALATAAPWACLAEHVGFIQQRAADFETTQAQFAAAHHRRAAEGHMDELEAIERDAEERLALLTEQAERLRFLEEDVGQVLALATADMETMAPDDPARPKRERALSLITHHTAQAHAAGRYEDASLALSRAADLANKLAF